MGKARAHFPSDLRPEDIAVVVDSREQQPFDLSPLRMVGGTLPTADYSVQGLEPHIAIERKSLDDLLGCVANGRPRFERELRRLLGYDVRAVVVEAGWDHLEAGQWRSKVTPAATVASVLGWISWGIPFVLAGDRERAARYTARILFLAARKRYRESRELVIGWDEGVVAVVGEENGVETAVQEGSKI